MPFLSLEKQEDYRRRYAEEHPGWQPASHVYRNRVAAHLGPSVRVLDLGCGRGGVVEELHGQAGRVVGGPRPGLAGRAPTGLPAPRGWSGGSPPLPRPFV